MKKKTISLLCVILIITALLSTFNFKSLAASTVEFSVDTVDAKPGETVSVNINLDKASEFTNFDFVLEYDTTKLTYNSCSTDNSILHTQNSVSAVNEPSGEKGTIKGAYATANGASHNAGKVVTLSFDVIGKAGETANLTLSFTGIQLTESKTSITDLQPVVKNGAVNIVVDSVVTKITLNHTSLSLEKGATSTLSVTNYDGNITWKSSNTSVATVSSGGIVTAVGAGTATITATADNNTSATCTVTVTESSNELNGINLDYTSISIPPTQVKTFKVTYDPVGRTDEITWKSSNENIVTVDKNGKITAIANGKATITATAGNKSTTCEVEVTSTLGDVDNNSSINSYDAYLTLSASVDLDLNKTISLDIAEFLRADVTRDEYIKSIDAYNILSYAVEKITSF